ncbi:MAG: imidazole glycerol phosphate synthase subunit HisH [Chloroflexi bacterium]|nr:imidazole glycerol phosphate synthase subunit HisH [Chloroflexota bacterium]
MSTSTKSGLRLAVVDYGAGNLHSVAKALEHVGHRPSVTADPHDLRAAEGVVFPGQGIAGPAMERLRAKGMDTALREVVAAGMPFFGVCLGLQLLFNDTEEGGVGCLGILRGRVVRFPPGLKVPHMGWNAVQQRLEHPAFHGVPDGTQFYFVHSYYGVPADRSVMAAETEYGVTFASAVVLGNLFATQFHPEKSGEPGLRLYANFFRAARGG